MHLLVLTDWPYPCDLTMLQEIFSKRLTAKGHNLTWVMRPGEDNSDGLKEYTWNGNEVYVPPNEAYDPARTALSFMSGQLSKHPVVEKLPNPNQFDAVHVRNDLSMALLATYFKRKSELPYVHQISHLKAESIIQIAKQGDSDSPLRDIVRGSLGRILRRFVVSQCDVTLTISDTLKEILRERGYPEPLVTFPTGADTSLDPSSIDPTPFRREYSVPDTPILLYMGTMTPIRKLGFLFDVLYHVLRELNVTLLMVGGRETANRERLQAEATARGVSDNVIFTGWLESREKVNQSIRAADIGLSPLPPTSILRTNAPLKVLEYLALETPAVASDTPDHRTVLKSSGAGAVASYDPKMFAEAIIDLLASPENLEEMGRKGREYIKKERSFDVLANRLLEIYSTYVFNDSRNM